MTLRLYDSATREVRDFVPLVEGRVGIYVCGATPQGPPHIGHVRAQVAFDILRRWLERDGYAVTLIRNVTDIDDKILAKAAEAGREWWAHAYLFEQAFSAAYDALGVRRPSYEPRATGHIPEMVEVIRRLIDRGHAYPAPDASGDVYFDVRSYPEYGSLTRQRIEDMEPAADADPRGKRDPRDFALWKGAKPSEPATASWSTPWGAGRPGWHLECSAMATRYLGPEFDIHGGGLDLRFPHHENEQAQSRAAGDRFARYWMHNGLVVIAGEKMSKSVGNTLSIEALLDQIRPPALRYLLSAAHYRSSIEIGPDSLLEASAAFERIQGFVSRATETLGANAAWERLERFANRGTEPLGEPAMDPAALASVPLPAAFAAAMDDDLGVPAALAVVHEVVREGNRALAAGDLDTVRDELAAVRAMTDVLGIDPLDRDWEARSADDWQMAALGMLVQAELDAREAARKERDFATADAIRDRLAAAGITVEDTPDGARWTLGGAG